MKDRKFYEAAEAEIISVQAENIIVTSTAFGEDGDEDKATGWKNYEQS